MSDLKPGQVQTVTGAIGGERLGPVLTHEHIFWDGVRGGGPRPVDSPVDQAIAEEPVRLDNLWWVRQHYTESRDNIVLMDEDTAIKELRRFESVGGGSVVDATPRGLGSDISALVRVSKASGLNIIKGTAYYVAASHPPELASKDHAEIADEFVADLLVGVGSSGVRCGVIGEIGCSWPLEPAEANVLRAASKAQRATGVSMLIHPGREPSAPLAHVREAVSHGSDPTRIIVSHVDRRIREHDALEELARSGCYLQFDCFGLEPWLSAETEACPMPCDLERLDLIEWLMTAGYIEQILISQDIAMKHRLATYGGHGYDHVLRNIVPLLRGRGATEAEVTTIVVDNPRRALTAGDAVDTSIQEGQD